MDKTILASIITAISVILSAIITSIFSYKFRNHENSNSNKEQISFPLTLTKQDWDKNLRGWRCPVLNTPGAIITSLFILGDRIENTKYEILYDLSFIRWIPDDTPKETTITISLTKRLTPMASTLRWKTMSISLIVFCFLSVIIPMNYLPHSYLSNNYNENCNSIMPSIMSPENNTQVSTPIEIKGSVSSIPKNMFLWAVVYNPNSQTYGNFQPINIDKKSKKWEKKINLLGGKIGNEYLIYLILANNKGDQALSNNISKARKSLPMNGEGMSKCCHISVYLDNY